MNYELNTSKGLDDYRTLKMNCMKIVLCRGCPCTGNYACPPTDMNRESKNNLQDKVDVPSTKSGTSYCLHTL